MLVLGDEDVIECIRDDEQRAALQPRLFSFAMHFVPEAAERGGTELHRNSAARRWLEQIRRAPSWTALIPS